MTILDKYYKVIDDLYICDLAPEHRAYLLGIISGLKCTLGRQPDALFLEHSLDHELDKINQLLIKRQRIDLIA